MTLGFCALLAISTGIGCAGDARMQSQGGTVVLDDIFDPYDAEYYGVEALQLKAGDKLNVECTFENTSDQTLH